MTLGEPGLEAFGGLRIRNLYVLKQDEVFHAVGDKPVEGAFSRRGATGKFDEHAPDNAEGAGGVPGSGDEAFRREGV
jgi:hypothetical protein